MPDARREVVGEDTSRSIAKAVWGLLLIWMGAALLLRWGWGIGLIGAGIIVLGAQVLRAYLHLKVDGFDVVAGLLLAICGVWITFELAFPLVPILCFAAGITLLVRAWTARRTPRATTGGHGDLHAPTRPRP